MRNWFTLSDPTMEEALYEIASLRSFAGLGLEAIPDETTILNFRHLPEASDLALIKRRFGLAKVRFKGLTKNSAHVITLFARSNLWMARKKLIAMMGHSRPQTA